MIHHDLDCHGFHLGGDMPSCARKLAGCLASMLKALRRRRRQGLTVGGVAGAAPVVKNEALCLLVIIGATPEARRSWSASSAILRLPSWCTDQRPNIHGPPGVDANRTHLVHYPRQLGGQPYLKTLSFGRVEPLSGERVVSAEDH
jgi:hypothetical protein